jgi:hypothetical protein
MLQWALSYTQEPRRVPDHSPASIDAPVPGSGR